MIWSTFGRRLVALPGISSIYSLLVAAGLVREKLTAARTYYVRTDGSNSNTGLVDSAGGAFLTIQKAIDVICTIDLNGFDVTISVGNGTYARITLSKNWVGGNVVLTGSTSAIISVTGNHAIQSTTPLSNVFTVSGMKLTTTTAGDCIRNINGGTINFTGTEFGSCGANHINADATGAIVQATGNYSITGGATTHILARRGGLFLCRSRTVTLTGTPAFSTAFASADQSGSIDAAANTYSGSATGTRYSATLNATIQTLGGGATYLPGNAVGTTATGGQYA